MIGISCIKYKNRYDNFYLDTNRKIVYYNGIKKELSEERIFNYIEKLFRIIDSWKEINNSLNVIDSNNFELLIKYENNKVKRYFGSSLPTNFEVFESLNRSLFKEV